MALLQAESLPGATSSPRSLSPSTNHGTNRGASPGGHGALLCAVGPRHNLLWVVPTHECTLVSPRLSEEAVAGQSAQPGAQRVSGRRCRCQGHVHTEGSTAGDSPGKEKLSIIQGPGAGDVIFRQLFNFLNQVSVLFF